MLCRDLETCFADSMAKSIPWSSLAYQALLCHPHTPNLQIGTTDIYCWNVPIINTISECTHAKSSNFVLFPSL